MIISRDVYSFGSLHGQYVALALVVILHLALVIPLAAILNIWIDEAYTLQNTGGNIVSNIIRALNFEKQPPFFYALLTTWR